MPSTSDEPISGMVISVVVSSTLPEPALTRSDTLSEMLNDMNVPLRTGPDPTGMLGGEPTVCSGR